MLATDRCRNCGQEFADHNYVKNSIDKYQCPYPQTKTHYGYFYGGDPNNFYPDAEACSPTEIERHLRACESWSGDSEARPWGCGYAPYGIGVTVFETVTYFELAEG